jgi:hypothetical protein
MAAAAPCYVLAWLIVLLSTRPPVGFAAGAPRSELGAKVPDHRRDVSGSGG